MTSGLHQPVRAGAPLSEGSASGASDRQGRRIVASSEQDKRLRAELAEGLGIFPRVWPPKTSPGAASRSRSARPERSQVSAMGGSGRIQVAPVGSPQGRTASHRDRASGTRIGGRPVRVSRDAKERRPSASVRVNSSDGSCGRVADTDKISRAVARRPGRPGPAHPA